MSEWDAFPVANTGWDAFPEAKPAAKSSGILEQITGMAPWLESATAQTKKDIAAYQAGGVPALMANTEGTQDLAGAFAGSGIIKSVGPLGLATKVVGRQPAELKAIAGKVYEANKDLPVPAEQARAVPDSISDHSLRQIPEVSRLSPKEPTYTPLERLQSEMNMEPLPAKPTPPDPTVQSLRDARMKLSDYAGETQDFKPTPRARAATQAINHIDDILDEVAPSIKNANADYTAARRAETLDYRTIKADHRAQKSGTGKNLENTMRQEVDKIPDRGLRPDEIALRNKITEGTFARNRLREAGKLGFGDAIPTMYHLAAAAPTAGISTGVGAVATIARLLGERATKSQIAQLRNMILSRAPSSASNRVLIAPSATRQQIIAALLGGQNFRSYSGGFNPAYANQNQP